MKYSSPPGKPRYSAAAVRQQQARETEGEHGHEAVVPRQQAEAAALVLAHEARHAIDALVTVGGEQMQGEGVHGAASGMAPRM